MYKCEYCGKEVYEKFGSGRFCSRSCSNGWVSKNQSKESKNKKIKALLDYDRKGIATRPKGSWTDEQRQNHSKIMSNVMRDPEIRRKISDSSRGRVLSERTRKIISDKLKISHKEGRNKGWVTRRGQESYAENFWRKVLENNDIPYQQEYTVRKSELNVSENGHYSLDFLLPGNVDLEIDGHQHYQESRKKHDLMRDERLSKSGYTVYRIKYINPSNTLAVQEDINKFINWYKLFISNYKK